MSGAANTEAVFELQRYAARVRALPAEQVDALPAAVQDLIVGVLRAANAERSAQWNREADERVAAAAPPSESAQAAEPADPEVIATAERGEPIARRLVVDAETDEWALAALTVRRRVQAGDLPRYPSADEYREWSDERLAALRMEPEEWAASVAEHDVLDLDADAVRDLPGADEPMEDPHPFNQAAELVAIAQQEFQRAEARRVLSALSAWRVAVEAEIGTPNAAMNSLFKGAVMVQIAHQLKVAERTALTLVNAAEDLEQRLPRTWRRFTCGEIPWRGMQAAHAQMDGLDPGLQSAYDVKAERILTTVPIPDAKQRLHEARERLQATTAVDRHERALQDQHVELENLPDGMAALMNIMPAAEAILARQALHEQAVAVAKLPGENRSIRQLESILMTDWLVQGARTDAPQGVPGILVPARKAAICKVGLLIPAMSALGVSDAPALLQGYGPIDIETAKRLAGAGSAWVKVLTDPVTGAVLNIGRRRYRPTADMRALLGVLDGGARGPNGVRRSGRLEIDHVTPFRQHLARGRTAIDNLVTLAGRHHDMKTAGWLAIELKPGSRTLVYTDWAGNRITVPLEPLEPTPVPEEYRAPVDLPVPF